MTTIGNSSQLMDTVSGRRELLGNCAPVNSCPLGATWYARRSLQAEVAQASQDGGDMAIGKRAEDLEGLLAGDEIFAFQKAAQEVDRGRGPTGI